MNQGELTTTIDIKEEPLETNPSEEPNILPTVSDLDKSKSVTEEPKIKEEVDDLFTQLENVLAEIPLENKNQIETLCQDLTDELDQRIEGQRILDEETATKVTEGTCNSKDASVEQEIIEAKAKKPKELVIRLVRLTGDDPQGETVIKDHDSPVETSNNDAKGEDALAVESLRNDPKGEVAIKDHASAIESPKPDSKGETIQDNASANDSVSSVESPKNDPKGEVAIKDDASAVESPKIDPEEETIKDHVSAVESKNDAKGETATKDQVTSVESPKHDPKGEVAIKDFISVVESSKTDPKEHASAVESPESDAKGETAIEDQASPVASPKNDAKEEADIKDKVLSVESPKDEVLSATEEAPKNDLEGEAVLSATEEALDNKTTDKTKILPEDEADETDPDKQIVSTEDPKTDLEQDSEQVSITGKRRKRKPAPKKLVAKVKQLVKHQKTPKAALQVPSRQIYCDICSMTFTCFRRYWNHKRLLHQKHSFSCSSCDKQFKKTSALLHHTKFRHEDVTATSDDPETGEALFYCEACGLGLRNIHKRVAHIEASHPDGYMFCSICNHACSSAEDMLFHTNEHSALKKTLFNCKVCNQDFYFLQVYVHHLRSHRKLGPKVKPKSFDCKVCCGKVNGIGNYIEHMELHFNSAPSYHCFICQVGYRSSGKLDRHMSYVHSKHLATHKILLGSGKVSKLFKPCYWCGLRFHKNKIADHIKKHATPKEKSVTCRVCLKSVMSWSYARHLAKHVTAARVLKEKAKATSSIIGSKIFVVKLSDLQESPQKDDQISLVDEAKAKLIIQGSDDKIKKLEDSKAKSDKANEAKPASSDKAKKPEVKSETSIKESDDKKKPSQSASTNKAETLEVSKVKSDSTDTAKKPEVKSETSTKVSVVKKKPPLSASTNKAKTPEDSNVKPVSTDKATKPEVKSASSDGAKKPENQEASTKGSDDKKKPPQSASTNKAKAPIRSASTDRLKTPESKKPIQSASTNDPKTPKYKQGFQSGKESIDKHRKPSQSVSSARAKTPSKFSDSAKRKEVETKPTKQSQSAPPSKKIDRKIDDTKFKKPLAPLKPKSKWDQPSKDLKASPLKNVKLNPIPTLESKKLLKKKGKSRFSSAPTLDFVAPPGEFLVPPPNISMQQQQYGNAGPFNSMMSRGSMSPGSQMHPGNLMGQGNLMAQGGPMGQGGPMAQGGPMGFMAPGPMVPGGPMGSDYGMDSMMPNQGYEMPMFQQNPEMFNTPPPNMDPSMFGGGQPMFGEDQFGNQYQTGYFNPEMQYGNQGMQFMDPNQCNYNQNMGQQFNPQMNQWQGTSAPAQNAQKPLFFGSSSGTTCRGCAKRFNTSKVLAVHEIFCVKLVDELSKPTLHICPICMQKFASLPTIKQHLFTSHAQIFKEFNLISGKDVHANNAIKECRTCKQQFKSKDELAAHEMTHEFLASIKSDLEKVDVNKCLLGKQPPAVKPVQITKPATVTSATTKAGSSTAKTVSTIRKNSPAREKSSSSRRSPPRKYSPKPSTSSFRSSERSEFDSTVEKRLQESLKKTQELEKAQKEEQKKLLDEMRSGSFKAKLEQQKKKLKINLLYFQKQKLEQEKKTKALEMLKAEEELKRIQRDLLLSQASEDMETIDLTEKRNERRRSPRRSRSRSRERSRKRVESSSRNRSPRPSTSESTTVRKPNIRAGQGSGTRFDRPSTSQPTTVQNPNQESESPNRFEQPTIVRKLNLKPGQEMGAYQCKKCATLFTNYRDYIQHMELHEEDDDMEENYLTQMEAATTVSSSSQNPRKQEPVPRSKSPSQWRRSPQQESRSRRTRSPVEERRRRRSRSNERSSRRRSRSDERSSRRRSRSDERSARRRSPVQQPKQVPEKPLINPFPIQANFSAPPTPVPRPPSSFVTTYTHLKKKVEYTPSVVRVRCQVCTQEFPSQVYLDYHACPGPF